MADVSMRELLRGILAGLGRASKRVRVGRDAAGNEYFVAPRAYKGRPGCESAEQRVSGLTACVAVASLASSRPLCAFVITCIHVMALFYGNDLCRAEARWIHRGPPVQSWPSRTARSCVDESSATCRCYFTKE